MLRALVVEDDPDYRAYVAALLKRVGFVTDQAEDGEAALDLLQRGIYDTAVIDQEMPRMSGVELVTIIRAAAETRGLYAVMLTGTDDVAAKLAALDAGFDDFLTKGYSEVEIVAKLVAARRIASRQQSLDSAVRELYRLATRDELTNVFNRRFFIEETDRLIGAGTPVSVVLFDLDEFKGINDTYGHLAGDSVLREVGGLFLRNTRPQDLIARYGGDEFVLVVSGLSPADARQIAMRLAREIGELRWAVGERSFTIRATMGFAASHHLEHPEVPRLLQAADRDLYRNKTGKHGAESSDETMPFLMPADAPASRTADPAPRRDRDGLRSAPATSE